MNIADVAFGLGGQPMPQPGGSVAAGFFAALEAAMAPGAAALPNLAGADNANAVLAGSIPVNAAETTAPNVPQVLAMLTTADAAPAIAAPDAATQMAAKTAPATPTTATPATATPTIAIPATVTPAPAMPAPIVAQQAMPPQPAPSGTAPIVAPAVAPGQPGEIETPMPASTRTAKRIALADASGIENEPAEPEKSDAIAALPHSARSTKSTKHALTQAPVAIDNQPAADQSVAANATTLDTGGAQAGSDATQRPAEAVTATPDAQPKPPASATAAPADVSMLAVAASIVTPVAAAPQQQTKPSALATNSRGGAAAPRVSRSNAASDATTMQSVDSGQSRGPAHNGSATGPQFQSKLAQAESDPDDAPQQKLAALGEPIRATPAPLPATDAPRATQTAAPVSAAAATPAGEPGISARHGEIGRELGVEVARRVSEGGEELRVRLNPAEFGRIEVKIAFDDGGTLRATVHAENPAALDLLRRDSADLNQAMGDAGVQADAQSFRFESRTDGQQRQQQPAQQQQQQTRFSAGTTPFIDDALPEAALAAYRPVRTPGRVDLLA